MPRRKNREPQMRMQHNPILVAPVTAFVGRFVRERLDRFTDRSAESTSRGRARVCADPLQTRRKCVHRSCVHCPLQMLAIARGVSCSNFRSKVNVPSHVSHNRTERALFLASQHVVAGAACWSCQRAHVILGARRCDGRAHRRRQSRVSPGRPRQALCPSSRIGFPVVALRAALLYKRPLT